MLALGAFLGLVALLVATIAAPGGGSHSPGAVRHEARLLPATGRAPERFAVRRLAAALPSPLQDAAAVALPNDTLALLGGLDASDTSTAEVLVLSGEHISTHARLPVAQHDAQGALLGSDAYVFGGGQFDSYDHVLRFDPVRNVVSQAGALPAPASDVAVAAVGETAYVVGGYDGARALDTILAWHPGASARVLARLPLSLRYAAVAAAGGQLIIAGGTHGETAEREILRFDPASGRITQIGRLPSPLTHAAAVALGGWVYLLGGHGTGASSQTDAILAIDPTSGRVVPVEGLPVALSDAAAAVVGGRVVLAGGEDASGTQSSIYSLTPIGARPAANG